MTPSKLKEQLMSRMEFVGSNIECEGCGLGTTETFCNPYLHEIGALIDILIQQQAALDKIANRTGDLEPPLRYWPPLLLSKIATEALASTAEKLKALGCE